MWPAWGAGLERENRWERWGMRCWRFGRLGTSEALSGWSHRFDHVTMLQLRWRSPEKTAYVFSSLCKNPREHQMSTQDYNCGNETTKHIRVNTTVIQKYTSKLWQNRCWFPNSIVVMHHGNYAYSTKANHHMKFWGPHNSPLTCIQRIRSRIMSSSSNSHLLQQAVVQSYLQIEREYIMHL
jgi:hypothetical protein